MPTLVRNSDGTTSIKHTKDDIARADAANAATAKARADQVEADAAKADMMTTARVSALAASLQAGD